LFLLHSFFYLSLLFFCVQKTAATKSSKNNHLRSLASFDQKEIFISLPISQSQKEGKGRQSHNFNFSQKKKSVIKIKLKKEPFFFSDPTHHYLFFSFRSLSHISSLLFILSRYSQFLKQCKKGDIQKRKTTAFSSSSQSLIISDSKYTSLSFFFFSQPKKICKIIFFLH
jgi:hypothetical protein